MSKFDDLCETVNLIRMDIAALKTQNEESEKRCDIHATTLAKIEADGLRRILEIRQEMTIWKGISAISAAVGGVIGYAIRGGKP